VALVRTGVSEECIASIIRVTRIGELVITVTSNRSTQRRNTTATWRNIPEDDILQEYTYVGVNIFTAVTMKNAVKTSNLT
jgi:hypothetical protein